MVSDSIQPTVLLLGAKSIASPLDSVPVELSAINQIFEEHQSDSLSFKIKYEPYLTLELLKTQLEKLAGQVTILHFAGHSDEASLQTDDEIVYAQHIADILETWTIQPALIFLNGCHNEEQVKLFLDADVAIVIATHRPIDDKQASGFACEFYQSLFAENGEVILQDAFDRAGAKVFLNQKGQPRSLNYESLDKTEAGNWDWGLFSSHPEYLEQWTIKQLISKNRPRLDTRGNLLNPYKGLEAFKEADKNWFFGRETQTIELTEEIQNTCFLTLMGASGSGKSSLINAGVIPCLRQEEDSLILQIRPGDSPISELARTFAKSLYPDSVSQRLNEQKALSAQLAKQQITISDLIHSLLQQTEKTKLYLFIDQFEELFTQSETPIVHDYLHQLIQLINSDVSCTLVVIMRADFLSSALANTEFATLMDNYPDKLLSPMSPAELREAIEKPANIQHVKLELALVEGLLDDIKSQPGYLPLLQYALSLLWQKRKNNHIKLEDYNASGGLEKALESRANEIYQTFTKKQKKHCKQIFLRLIQPGEGTEDTRRLASLEEFSDKDNVQDIIKKLVDARLITTQQNRQSEDVFAEVSHEALIKHWSQLRKWITEDRDELRTQHQISAGAKEWKEHGRDKAWLFSGSRLAVSEDWLSKHTKQTTALEKKFVQAGIKERDRQRKRKRNTLVTFITMLSLIALIAVSQWRSALKNEEVATDESRKAQKEKLEANYHLAKAFEEKALAAIYKGNQNPEKNINEYRNAWLYALEAAKIEIPQNRVGLKQSSLNKLTDIDGKELTPERKQSIGRIKMHDQFSKIVFSLDGNMLATSYVETKTVYLWDFSKGAIKHTFNPLVIKSSILVAEFAFSPDGKTIAIAFGDDDTIGLWDTQSGELNKRYEKPEPLILGLAFSLDGEAIKVLANGKSYRLSTQSGNIEQILEAPSIDNTIAYSLDGKLIATDTMENSIQIWNNEKGQLIHTLEGHKDDVESLTFSPDNSILASGSRDTTIRLWDIDSGELIHTLKHDSTVYSLSFRPDGKVLVSGGISLRWWNAENGALLRSNDDDGSDAEVLSFHPDGEFLITSAYEGTNLWNSQTAQRLSNPYGHSGEVNAVAFNSDDSLILSGSSDHTVRLWDANSISLIQVFKGHTDVVNAVAFSPDGKIVASGSDDKKILIWNTKTGKLKQRLEGHEKEVKDLVFSPDGNVIVSASADQTVKIWNSQTGQLKSTLKGHTGSVNSVAINPDGRIIASGSDDGSVRLWNAQTEKLKLILNEHSDGITDLAFNPYGKTLVSGSDDKSLILWDIETGKIKKTFIGHTDGITGLGFEGAIIASGSHDETIRLWDIETGKVFKIIETRVDSINALAFRYSDGLILVYGAYDHTIRIIDAPQPTFPNEIKTFSNVFAFGHLDGVELAYASEPDHSVDVFSLEDNKLRVSFTGHKDFISCLAYSPDGRVIATGSYDKTIRLWNNEIGGNKLTINAHTDNINDLLYSSDGKIIVSGSSDKTIRIWDAESGQLIKTFESTSAITSLSLSPDNKILASISESDPDSGLGGRMLLWDMQSGTIKQTIKGSFQSVNYSPDGKMIVINDHFRIHVWDDESGKLVQSFNDIDAPIFAYAISPDSRTMAISSDAGGVITLVDLQSRKLKYSFEVGNANVRFVYGLAYSPDGSVLASVSGSGLRLWKLSSLSFRLFYDFDPKQVSNALKFLWEMELDSESSQFVYTPRTPSLRPINGYYFSNTKFRSLLDAPKPDESKMDQLVRWLEQQCAYKDEAKVKACQQQ